MKLKRIFSCLTAAAIAVSAIAITVNTSAEQNEVSLTYNLRNNSINSETYAKLTVVNLYESSIISKASWTADDKWVTLTDEDGNAYQKQVAGIDTGYITFGTDNGFITGGGIYNKEGLRIGVSEPCGEMVEFEFTARPYRDKVNEIEEKYQTLTLFNTK